MIQRSVLRDSLAEQQCLYLLPLPHGHGPIVVLSYYSVSAAFGLIALYLHKIEKLVALGAVAVLMVVILLILARTDPGKPAPGEPARSEVTD